MSINEVKIKEGTGAAIVKKSTTAGLASGYQRTSTTSMSVSAIETAGGLFLVDVFTLPIFTQFDEVERPERSDIVMPEPIVEMMAGYREMSEKNSLLAEEFLPVALESWPKWGE